LNEEIDGRGTRYSVQEQSCFLQKHIRLNRHLLTKGGELNAGVFIPNVVASFVQITWLRLVHTKKMLILCRGGFVNAELVPTHKCSDIVTYQRAMFQVGLLHLDGGIVLFVKGRGTLCSAISMSMAQ
jgi:hypothetical protein